MMRSKDDNGPFAWFIFAEAVMILLYGLFTRYDDIGVNTDVPVDNAAFQDYYALYQDVHVMIFVGFGFLMTFLRKYGYGAVGLTFFLSSFVIQWSILVRGFWERVFHRHFDKINLNVLSLINADFAAGTVMISFGAVLGKVRPSFQSLLTPHPAHFAALLCFFFVNTFSRSRMGLNRWVLAVSRLKTHTCVGGCNTRPV
jgi:hypothetical protein